jgi:hypothetical protein
MSNTISRIKFIIDKESVYKADLEKVVNLTETVFCGWRTKQPENYYKKILMHFDDTEKIPSSL